MSTEIADASRVLEWMRDPNRKPAQLAFTHGPERQAAYWIEIAQAETGSRGAAGCSACAEQLAPVAQDRDDVEAKLKARIAELEAQQAVLSVIVSQAIALHPEWEAAKKALAAVNPSDHEVSALVPRLTALLSDAKNLFSESVEPEAKQHAADIGMCAQLDVDVLAWLRNADEVLAAVKSVAMFNGMTEAETNTTASVAGLAARKTCAVRGFMFGNDGACWFYCVGGGCGSDEPCEHQLPAGQKGSE